MCCVIQQQIQLVFSNTFGRAFGLIVILNLLVKKLAILWHKTGLNIRRNRFRFQVLTEHVAADDPLGLLKEIKR